MPTTNESLNGVRTACQYTMLRFSGNPCTPHTTVGGGSRNTFVARSRTATGNKVPNYRSLIAMGHDASGAYSLAVTRQSYGECSGYAEWNGANCSNSKPPPRESDTVNGGTFYSGTFQTVPDFSASVSAALNDARGKFYSQASQLESTGLTFLGELRETVHMLRHPFKSGRDLITDYLSSLRKNAPNIRRMNRSRKSRFLSDAWLEYKFGWEPLLMDIRDIHDAAIRLENEIEFVRLRGYSRRESKQAFPTTLIGGPGVCLQLYKMETTEAETFAVCRGAYRLSRYVDAPLSAINQNFGLTLSGFIPTVWELIPYSFVVDYFTNIGDILAAACVCSGNIAWSNTSQVIRKRSVQRFSQGPYTPAFRESLRATTGMISHGDNEREDYSFSRSVGVQAPSFQVSLPGAIQTVNLLALLNGSRAVSRLID